MKGCPPLLIFFVASSKLLYSLVIILWSFEGLSVMKFVFVINWVFEYVVVGVFCSGTVL